MNNQSIAKLTIALKDSDLDDEELDRQTRNLLQEIKDFNVETAELAPVEEIPPGAMGAGGFLLGVLRAEVSFENCLKLLRYLRDRLNGKPIKIKIKKPNGEEFEVEANNQQDFQIAIAAVEKFLKGE